MKQQQLPESSSDSPIFQLPLADQQIWSMRWFALIAFILIFMGSLIVIAMTNNPLLFSLPGSLLLAMRPIIRFIFPQEPYHKKPG
jgi:hypothetical protein